MDSSASEDEYHSLSSSPAPSLHPPKEAAEDSNSMALQVFTPAQAHALFDMLTHHEIYQEIRDLRHPGALEHSGPPFKTTSNDNRLPLIYTLFNQFLVPLPGLRDVSPSFYSERCQIILEELANADLSESYDAGYIGIRRTLATAAAALLEAPARGFYGGFAKQSSGNKTGRYDISNPKDLQDGFHDLLQGIIYGNQLDEVIDVIATTDKLENQSEMVQAAHEYILIILASFLHYILVLTPEGQNLFTMLKQVHMLIPWLAIRQTLRIGNVATMISAMMKIILTKMTLNSVTSMLRITAFSDAGWNLLQTIIWTVLNYDTSSLKSRAADIEKSKTGPTKAQLDLLQIYVDEMTAEEHALCRKRSERESQPLVSVVMEELSGPQLSAEQIPMAIDYLSIKFSLRDRKKLVETLCSRQPDVLSQAVREGVDAYEPIIRALHKAADLSATMGDMQNFTNDLVALAPVKNGLHPTVSDFVKLLRKHQYSLHKFMHQLCKNGPEMVGWYKDYARRAASLFRINDPNARNGGAGNLNFQLNNLVYKLPEKQKAQVLAECDAYAAYLDALNRSSEADLKFDHATTDTSSKSSFMSFKTSRTSTPKPKDSRSPSPQRTEPGPGIFIRRWQAYMHETSITPARPKGPVRYGSDQEVIASGRIANIEAARASQLALTDPIDGQPTPSIKKTVEYMSTGFRDLLRQVATKRPQTNSTSGFS